MEKRDYIVLDLAGCGYLGDLHGRLKKAFDLPDYYGEYWSALWDCLSEPFDPTTVVVRGLETVSLEKSAVDKLLEILRRNVEWQDDFKLVIE